MAGARRPPSNSRLLLLLVLAVSAIVAVTAPGEGLLLAPGEAAGRSVIVRVLGLAAAAGGLAYLVLGRRRLPPVTGRGRDPSAAALAGAALVMGILALVSALAFGRYDDRRIHFPEREAAADTMFPDQQPDGPPVPRAQRAPSRSLLPIMAPGGGVSRSRAGDAATAMGEDPLLPGPGTAASTLQTVALAVLALLLLVAVGIAVRILARPMRDDEPQPAMSHVAVPDAVAALEASLLDVAYDGTDPRLRITVAYHGLLNAIAEAGAPREPQEAPHEYLHRSLSPLGVQPEPMHRLAELYVLAQFSRHPLREEHCAMAAEALEQSIRHLHEAGSVVGATS